MTSFGAKFEHLLSSRAEIISRMHKPPPAEGNNLEELLGEEPIPSLPVPKPNNPVWPDEDAAAFCALTPPLETFMVVPDDTRKDQFYRTAQHDDMLIGSVTAIQDSGLVITILAYDQGPRRDFDGLGITGFCPLSQLPRLATHGNPLDAFQIGDKVRVFILDVHRPGRLILSMNEKALNTDLFGRIQLGTIPDDEFPLHYRKLQNLDGKSFEACLLGNPQFKNPDGLRVLCARFGIPRSSACSLLLSNAKIHLPKQEMACELRRVQLYNMSMRHVAQGVKYFKDNRNTEALQCYNFAIQVESTNADAYVARGAFYTKAIDDLEKSLSLQPGHANATNYLGQTLLAYAIELTSKDPEKAATLLHRALELDPTNAEAREALRHLPNGGIAPIQSSSHHSRDVSMRSWSRSPQAKRGNAPMDVSHRRHEDRSPTSPDSVKRAFEHGSSIDRSRAVLEKLVYEDRSRRGQQRKGEESDDGFQSPPSRGRFGEDRHRDEPRRGERSNESVEKSNLPKIVITRDRSGRVIRCEDENRWREDSDRGGDRDRNDRDMSQSTRARGRGGPGGDREYRRFSDNRERDWRDDRRAFDNARESRDDRDSRRRDDWKVKEERSPSPAQERQEERNLPQSEFQYDRRVYTPPKDAVEVENGVLTKYVNKSDLPLTSKTLQDRVQQRLKDIERRHRVESGGDADGWRGRGGFRGDRGGRGRSGVQRGGRGGWRGSWRDDNDWRGNRRGGGWQAGRDRYGGDRRGGDGPDEPRRRRRYDRSRSISRSRSKSPVTKRRRRSRGSRSPSRSRSGSYSRSVSRSPIPRKRISRARIKTPPLAPLTNKRNSDTEDHMAEVEQFVAQLQAKRQMEAENKEKADQPLIGPQIPNAD